eukprot:gene7897-9414_t
MTVKGDDDLAFTERLVDQLGTPNVVFENCSFDAVTLIGDQSGVYADHGGTITLLNCFLQNFSGAGVLIRGQGRATLVHCLIQSCFNGISIGANKSGMLNILNCTISKILQCGLLLDEAGPTDVRGCKLARCDEYGIYASGRHNYTSRITISECTVSECMKGINFRMGKIDARIRSCTVRKNCAGVLVCQGVLGTVEVQQCNVTENSHYQYLNTNSVDCAFSIDGTILNATRVDREKPPKHLFARRCYQQAGLCDITCLNCSKIEETGVKFKKCGKCEGVVYCGRKCQKAHWKEHKKECEQLKDFWKEHTMEKVLPKRANP